MLSALVIANPPPDIPAYSRNDWKLWIDADHDCQNTRAEVLIAESLKPVTFTSSSDCTVATGDWVDPYTGTEVTAASDLDIDHMVPLGNAHDSGAWAWSAQQKEDYANYLGYADQLIAVTAHANRSKGDRGPEDWRPPLVSDWCTYATDWITIKATWHLTATQSEVNALEDMLGHCTAPVVFRPVPATPVPTATATTTPTPTATATSSSTPTPTSTSTPVPTPTTTPVSAVSAGSVFVTEMMINPSAVSDANGEWFEVYNSLKIPVNMNKWTIRDFDTDSHVIDNGGPLVIPAHGHLVLGRNIDSATNGGVVVNYQYSGVNLANTGDEIELVDSSGAVIDTVAYTSAIVLDGKSASLNPAAMNATANDKMANWCPASTPLSGGDRGTPGAANDKCR